MDVKTIQLYEVIVWYFVAFLYWVIQGSKREKILTVNNRREAETHHHVHQQSQAGHEISSHIKGQNPKRTSISWVG